MEVTSTSSASFVTFYRIVSALSLFIPIDFGSDTDIRLAPGVKHYRDGAACFLLR